MEYKQVLEQFPNNQLSTRWIQELVEFNNGIGYLISELSRWVIVTNWKFKNEGQDPQFAYKVKEHITIFSKENVSDFIDLSRESLNQMFIILYDLQRNGYHVYYNSSLVQTVKRAHFHAVKWAEKDGKPILIDKKINAKRRKSKSGSGSGSQVQKAISQ